MLTATSSLPTPPVGARRRWRMAVAFLLVLMLAVMAGIAWRASSPVLAQVDAELARSLPRMNAAPGFAGSQQCRECHPDEHASWHASYHRQMTQVARPETVLGPFDGTLVKHAGEVHRLVCKGDQLWVESWPEDEGTSAPDADVHPKGEGTWRRVVMTTGAHHMQAYWAAYGDGNRLYELPIVFLRDHRHGKDRWAPLAASYISQSPPGLEGKVHWNTDCILCHATGGVPGLETSGATSTAVAELGISCESCHGPAHEHIRMKREQGRHSPEDPFEEHQRIINPARLPPERAAQVCGHCHAAAMFVTKQLMEDFLLSGSNYRPGDDLLRTRIAILPARLTSQQNDANQRYNPAYEGSYWPDGIIRVTGREYNALVESTCYQKGGMTCLSCHSMHQSDPNDQLSATGRGNEACYQCHASYRNNVTAHTHHQANSTGSECYNCHMPHTTYGLFTAIRSHKVTSPNVASVLATGRPSACNLCHLDQTLEWTNRKLADWYGHAKQELDEEQSSLSAAGVLLLKGDAAQRVLLAWAAGWQPAQAASSSDWLAPLLAPLLEDPSPVIRLVASRSLASVPPGYALDYDFVAHPGERRAARRQLMAAWHELRRSRREKLPARLFVKPGGDSDEELIDRFVSQRDDRGLLMMAE